MPATKITELTAISTVNTTVDPLAIVDVSDTTQASSGTTKKITVSQIDSAIFGASGSKAIVVDNVAALKALTVSGIADGQLYITRGYYSDNDGGQGTYIYDTSSAVTDNGGTVIAPTAGSGRFLLQYSDELNVKQFGAKGDGSTNDLSAIQSAAAVSKSSGGLTIKFPDGNYRIVFPSGMSAYDSLIKLTSNSEVKFTGGASISASAITGSNLYSSVFGIDLTALPVSNVRFENLNMVQDAALAGQENTAAVMLCTAQNGSSDSIQNVTITGCKFVSFACPIYILHRSSSGSTSRQVNGVKILNNYGSLNPSFITADGKNIVISENIASGDESGSLYTYDAVSVHSGIDVEISNNIFSGYNEYAVNIRNNPNNLCGSKNILVNNNVIKNCALKGVGVSLASGESTYGVDSISISNNSISNSSASNSSTAILVDVGSASAGTPISFISISNNKINQCNSGIQIKGTLGILCKRISIVGNFIEMLSGNTDYALYVKNVDIGSVSSNSILSLYSGASHTSVSVDYFAQSVFSGNQITTFSPYSSSVVFNNLLDCSFSGNSIYGKYVFSNIASSVSVNGNRLVSSGTCNGRVLIGYWTLNSSVINYYGSPSISGSWYVGDQVLYTPTAGGYIGKVCVTAGSPGTFKDFGAISV
jgi:hypothetical protein